VWWGCLFWLLFIWFVYMLVVGWVGLGPSEWSCVWVGLGFAAACQLQLLQ
jgi:hypothetical protein